MPLMTVNACPRCGRKLITHCHHNGRDIPAIPMDLKRAIELMGHEIHTQELELNRLREEHQDMLVTLLKP